MAAALQDKAARKAAKKERRASESKAERAVRKAAKKERKDSGSSESRDKKPTKRKAVEEETDSSSSSTEQAAPTHASKVAKVALTAQVPAGKEFRLLHQMEIRGTDETGAAPFEAPEPILKFTETPFDQRCVRWQGKGRARPSSQLLFPSMVAFSLVLFAARWPALPSAPKPRERERERESPKLPSLHPLPAFPHSPPSPNPPLSPLVGGPPL